MARHARLAVSYVIDWVVVILFAVGGGLLSWASGFHRPFSLADPAIAYPYKPDIVSLAVVVVISLVAPVVIIAVLNVGAALLSRQHAGGSTPSPPLWRRDAVRAVAWETHAGWLGLCAGLAGALFVTSGLKDMVGKPRPDLLARCDPDVDALARYVVGGLGRSLGSEAHALVSSDICRQPDRALLNDGFASFPSGHSSFCGAGMTYMTLWLCARWNVVVGRPSFLTGPKTREEGGNERKEDEGSVSPSSPSSSPLPQDDAAAAPLWLTAIAFLPIVLLLFVCTSRYADFHHAGFDIIAGAFIGITMGWSCFHLYHAPLGRSSSLRPRRPRPGDSAFLGRVSRREKVEDEEQARDPRRPVVAAE